MMDEEERLKVVRRQSAILILAGIGFMAVGLLVTKGFILASLGALGIILGAYGLAKTRR